MSGLRQLLVVGLLLVGTASSYALDIALGSAVVRAGNNATITVNFANAPANPISAFAFYLSADAALGIPSVTGGAHQANLSAFADNFGSGVHRITGFVLENPSISNGHVATLTYAVPANTPAGRYPINFTAVALNPEARALVTSDLITGLGTGGSITVVTAEAAPLITAIIPQPGQTFLLQFSGSAGLYYTVEATTNLIDWLPITNLQAGGGGLFQFIDSDSTNHPMRFYRAVYP